VAGVNSALQRARATVDPQLPASPSHAGRGERELLRRYVDAWEQADIAALVALLRDDAVITMPPQPTIHGAAAIGAFMARVAARHELVATPTAANRQPAVALYERTDGGLVPHRLLLLDVEDGRIAQLHAFGAETISRG
jgi:RNA polymerase sigma-70 factor (ECF subfamily)